MTSYKQKAHSLVEYFAHFINTPLELRDGVCALYDGDNQQSVVIEAPENSKCIILHCTLIQLISNVSTETLRALLLINFEVSAMQGCWLAIDESENICLCNMLDLEKTDREHFKDTLLGFIEQVSEVRDFLFEILNREKISTQ